MAIFALPEGLPLQVTVVRMPVSEIKLGESVRAEKTSRIEELASLIRMNGWNEERPGVLVDYRDHSTLVGWRRVKAAQMVDPNMVIPVCVVQASDEYLIQCRIDG